MFVLDSQIKQGADKFIQVLGLGVRFTEVTIL